MILCKHSIISNQMVSPITYSKLEVGNLQVTKLFWKSPLWIILPNVKPNSLFLSIIVPNIFFALFANYCSGLFFAKSLLSTIFCKFWKLWLRTILLLLVLPNHFFLNCCCKQFFLQNVLNFLFTSGLSGPMTLTIPRWQNQQLPLA